jgi:DHA2 family multidrug resistance protein
MRNVGGSIGISIASTLLTRRSDVHQNEILNSVPITGQQFQNHLGALQSFLSNPYGHANALAPAQATLYQQLQRQATTWSFVDVFRWLSLLCFFCVPIVWMLRKVKPGKPPAGAH